jgi:hypothetical protein
MTANTETVRALNDGLRRDFSLGRAVRTTGIAALGAEAVARIVKTIAVYDDFCNANDPYEEHDFGAFEVDRSAIFSAGCDFPSKLDGALFLNLDDVDKLVVAVSVFEPHKSSPQIVRSNPDATGFASAVFQLMTETSLIVGPLTVDTGIAPAGRCIEFELGHQFEFDSWGTVRRLERRQRHVESP